jgi:hypothetical protein
MKSLDHVRVQSDLLVDNAETKHTKKGPSAPPARDRGQELATISRLKVMGIYAAEVAKSLGVDCVFSSVSADGRRWADWYGMIVVGE